MLYEQRRSIKFRCSSLFSTIALITTMRNIKNEWLAGGSEPWRIREVAFASKIQRRTWRRSLVRELGRLRPDHRAGSTRPGAGQSHRDRGRWKACRGGCDYAGTIVTTEILPVALLARAKGVNGRFPRALRFSAFSVIILSKPRT